jgi:hypothetical protein
LEEVSMATQIIVPVSKIANVRVHPNASMLGLAQVSNYQVVVGLVEDPKGSIVRHFLKGKLDDKGKRIPLFANPMHLIGTELVLYQCYTEDKEGVKTFINPEDVETVNFSFRYHEGDLIVYVPGDSIITDEWADKLGIKTLLKGGNRVAKIALRGEPSFGLVIEIPEDKKGIWQEGDNVADYFGITKYEPPVRANAGDAAPYDSEIDPYFDKFTDIQNLRFFSSVFQPGEEVVISEKLHGTSDRVGVINGHKVAGSMELRRAMPVRVPKNELTNEQMVGMRVKKPSGKPFKSGNKINTVKEIVDHPNREGVKAFSFYEDDSVVDCNTCVPESLMNEPVGFNDEEVKKSTYWFPWSLPPVEALLEDLSKSHPIVELFGEVYGHSIQKGFNYDAGNGLGFRAFGIKTGDKFLDWHDFEDTCNKFGVPMVPVLYKGPFDMAKTLALAEGNTTVGNAPLIEGVVVVPVKERCDPKIGRVALKCVGIGYDLLKNKPDSKDV